MTTRTSPALPLRRLLAGIVLTLSGCGGGGAAPLRQPTCQVSGTVTVDGVAPAESIQIQCHRLSPADPHHTTVSAAQSGTGGEFAISTYESGDGVPAGEYALTFEWRQLNLVSMSYGGPDKLHGRYQEPAKSMIKFTVVDGAKEPIDLGTIALTTK